MHQREQETCAQRRRLATKLTDIADGLFTSRCLVAAAEMAAHSLTKEERDPLVELLAIVSDRLKAISAEITAEISPEGTADAA